MEDGSVAGGVGAAGPGVDGGGLTRVDGGFVLGGQVGRGEVQFAFAVGSSHFRSVLFV